MITHVVSHIWTQCDLLSPMLILYPSFSSQPNHHSFFFFTFLFSLSVISHFVLFVSFTIDYSLSLFVDKITNVFLISFILFYLVCFWTSLSQFLEYSSSPIESLFIWWYAVISVSYQVSQSSSSYWFFVFFISSLILISKQSTQRSLTSDWLSYP